jgi:hypothetical protein
MAQTPTNKTTYRPGRGPGGAFLENLVADQRLVIRLRVSRLYGTSIDLPTGT